MLSIEKGRRMRDIAAAALVLALVIGMAPGARAADPAPDRVVARVNQTEIT